MSVLGRARRALACAIAVVAVTCAARDAGATSGGCTYPDACVDAYIYDFASGAPFSSDPEICVGECSALKKGCVAVVRACAKCMKGLVIKGAAGFEKKHCLEDPNEQQACLDALKAGIAGFKKDLRADLGRASDPNSAVGTCEAWGTSCEAACTP